MTTASQTPTSQAWDAPVYYEPVRYRPRRRHHALSISLALAVITTGLIGGLVYHRLDTLSDIDTYVAMGPSQSHIEADQAGSEPTLLVTLTPPVYAALQSPVYTSAVPASAQTTGAEAGAIVERIADDAKAKPAETVAADSLPADPDPVAALPSEESLAKESLDDSAM